MLKKSWIIKGLYVVLLVTYSWRIYMDKTTDSRPGLLFYLGTLSCWIAIIWLHSSRKPKG